MASVNDPSPAFTAHQEQFTPTPTDDVPEGNVDEVLGWAGDDPARRTAALEAEKAGQNRKGIIEALEGDSDS